ncbi:MAG: type I restriction endonuclease [Rhodospirillales bacterium]|nr:type I restriction endonuclease [Rhodospirillales bacterium]
MGLAQDIEDIRLNIKAGRFANEASVSQGIVLRILHALAWPAYDTRVVCPEYSLSGRRVDFALCHPAGKPIAFIEVKQIGQSDGAERQLFEYAFHEGVPIAILTDGQEWNFYLPAEQGDYGERRVYKLDIVERDVDECVARLERYLRHDIIASGEAIAAAREDYKDASKKRQILATLPVAWERLVSNEDEMLLEIVADCVENLCGFKPDPDMVAKFLKTRAGEDAPKLQPAPSRPQREPALVDHPARKPPAPAPTKEPTLPSAIGFTFDGQNHPCRNACDVMIKVFETLSQRDATFPERFAALPKHGRTRRYLARNADELYPGRLDLCREHSTKLKSGWWISTNHSKATIGQIIKRACDVVGLRFGSDLVVNLGD